MLVVHELPGSNKPNDRGGLAIIFDKKLEMMSARWMLGLIDHPHNKPMVVVQARPSWKIWQPQNIDSTFSTKNLELMWQ